MHSPRKLRLATTTVEIVVAVVLLGSAIAMVGKFVASVNSGLAERELSARLGWEITNVRELIGAWNPAEITEERIEALPVTESITGRLPDSKWVASVSTISEPAEALQIELRLECTYQGQSAVPVELTFWVDREAVHD